ncbi:MAG: type II 3-dehydroquinate dehydratase [Bacteroidales bacterium]|jgi:3-dehydroquinate dehydratase-2|nr:type II 3-dehydroquinate dehydratase [Bacteroidales bacterium]
MDILILNGANLNLLGKREPVIYGDVSMEEFLEILQQEYISIRFDCFQSNVESVLVEKIQQAESQYQGIIINAGGFTHTSVAISDAIRAICIPVVEVHISNIFSRESYRRKSYLSEVCVGSICGFGLNSYRLAIEGLLSIRSRFRQESCLSD